MTQANKATAFKALHKQGAPLVLYNIWDAGTAKAVANAGAKALATGSKSVAAAQGYDDGELIPLEHLLQIVTRITATTDLPLSVDFEGCYSAATEGVTENLRKVIKAGAIGINFEDQIVGSAGIYPIAEQCARITAARNAAQAEGVPLFINARTDLFLKSAPEKHADHVAEAIERAAAYAKAGADGFFVPGLTDANLIKQVVKATDLPVNVMLMGGWSSHAALAALGVRRISYGPGPYLDAMADMGARVKALA